MFNRFLFLVSFLLPFVSQSSLNPKIVDIDGGSSHQCILFESEVKCFGANNYGETETMSGLTNPKKVAAGNAFTCVIDDENVWCTGTLAESTPSLESPTDLAAGHQHACAVSGGRAYCWGPNSEETKVPSDIGRVRRVVAGSGFSCAMTSSDLVCWGNQRPLDRKNLNRPVNIYGWNTGVCVQEESGENTCWGRDDYGEVGVASILSNLSGLSIGPSHACAIDEKLICWGSNQKRQLDVPDLSNPTHVSVGFNFTCAVDENGIHCWGEPSFKVPRILVNPRDLAVGNNHGCALDDHGVVCWGANYQRQLEIPVDVEKNPNAIEIDTTTTTNCVLMPDSVHCWGYGSSIITGAPKGSLVSPSQLAVSHDFACVIDLGEVKCWGRGPGLAIPSDLGTVQSLSAGNNHICALDEHGVVCWGENSVGESQVPRTLQDPANVHAGHGLSCASSNTGPVRCWGSDQFEGALNPPEIIGPSEVAMGHGFGCAISDGEVICWGESNYGQLEVPGDLKNPRQLSAGMRHSCILHDDGMDCWGHNNYSQANAPVVVFR